MGDRLDADLLEQAVSAIDAANADDPFTVSYQGEERPKELLHSERMTHWVTALDPGADAAQRIAARAHHLRRWVSPRSSYPDGRAGYLRWRTDQRKRQTAELAEILTSVGCDPATTDRALAIVAKQGIKTDPAVQTHEDALCLVFLELQVDELAEKLEHDHMVEVLRKSLVKMSAPGIEMAATIPLSDRGRAVLADAVAALGD